VTIRPDPPRAIIIRNVPESVRRELKARAAKEGKSMQGVLLELIIGYVGGLTSSEAEWVAHRTVPCDPSDFFASITAGKSKRRGKKAKR
jgi:hypothetical protein